MAYFLRSTKRKNGDIYFQIYESYYNRERRKNMNRSIKKLGLLSSLKKENETDQQCIDRIKEEVAHMEDDRKDKTRETIDDRDMVSNIGYFLMASVVQALNVSKKIDLFALDRKFRFSPADLLFSLAYARTINPCSKRRTNNEVFPAIYGINQFSDDQIYRGLDFLGSCYEEIIEVINCGIANIHKRKTDHCYFDCTNFYFEIDLEDEFRRKGPSKENRPLPLVSMALLLDSQCIPLKMELFAGNQSEKPYLPKVIQDVKASMKSDSKIIEVADKGLNCVKNIVTALARKDGYIFSKSIKTAKENEFDWIFDENGWTEHYDSNGKFIYSTKSKLVMTDYIYTTEEGKRKKISLSEKRVATFNPDLRAKQQAEIGKLAAKAMNSSKASIKKDELGPAGKYAGLSCVNPETGEEKEDDTIVVTINTEKIEEDLKNAGYNVLVTSELNMSDTEVYEAYHQLWNIERTFRIMKTQLSARPVYVSKENCIKGHFLTCYTAVTLIRMIQKWMFKDRYSAEEIIEYIRKFQIFECGNGEWLNLMKKKDATIGKELYECFTLPVLSRHLNEKDLTKILALKFKASSRK